MTKTFAGIETGGTKFACIIGSGPDDIYAETSFPTTTPEETLSQALAFFQKYRTKTDYYAIGIGSFGPVDLDPTSKTFGYTTNTPKVGWAHRNIANLVASSLRVPVAFDTDANVASLAEATWGNAHGLDNFVYVTVGTGIGGGGMTNRRLLHGLIHPEMGHMRVPHNFDNDPYDGHCPFHKDCLEGLAAGPAIRERWGQAAETLSPDHQAWTLEAHYLALGLVNIICTLSPQRIILGGGVMKQPKLFSLIRRDVSQLMNEYLASPALLERIHEYIVPPALGDRVGILGTLALAKQHYAHQDPSFLTF